MATAVASAKLLFCSVKQAIKHGLSTMPLVKAAAMAMSLFVCMGLASSSYAAQALVPQPPQ